VAAPALPGLRAVVAINNCYAYRGEMSLFQSGFEPRLEKLRLGYVLVGWSIEQAIAEGMRVFDFLKGEYAYKRIWAADSRSAGLLHAYRRTPRGFLFGLRRHVLPDVRRRLQAARPGDVAPEASAQG
jgi:CelD/BcsL family acetyltransferase involved in cellulose biosynthesis